MFDLSLINQIKHTESLIDKLEGNALMDVICHLVTLNERYEHVIYEFLLDGGRTFKSRSLKQEAFVSKSAKVKDVYQFTYFDSKGAVGDLLADNFKVLAKGINEMGFLICHNDELKILY